ncbi:MAG: amino acid adenylation domain-containing protein [Sphingomonas sp.]|nr:amino acid adenylation domain-containing protein [Sphingomonas sp.]
MQNHRAPLSVPARIDAFRETTPDCAAIAAACGETSYQALVARADGFAARLVAAGVARDDVVAVCLPRSADQVAALIGCWRAGAAYLPLDPDWPAARRADLVARAGCAAVIAAEAIGAVPLVTPAEAVPAPGFAPREGTLAYVIYTSGSTGTPKGVEIAHANLAALVDWHAAAFGMAPGMRASHVAGLAFDAAAWEVWAALGAGGTLCLPDETSRKDAALLQDWLVRERVEIAFAPTALAEPLVAMDWPAGHAMKVLLTGADKLTARPRADLPFRFVNNYGPTECTVVATSGEVAAVGEGLPDIGRAIAGTTVHLLYADGSPADPGEAGEIWIGGAGVGRGYRGEPAMTAERFVDHAEFGRLYRSGDLARERADGALEFLGRADDQVKVRGHRVEPAEIVAVLNRQSGIAASAVVLREGNLIGYVVPQPGATPDAAALREALSGALPDYMVPFRFARLAALPLNSSGKLDRAALPDPAGCALEEHSTGRAPESVTEERLLEGIAWEVRQATLRTNNTGTACKGITCGGR